MTRSFASTWLTRTSPTWSRAESTCVWPDCALAARSSSALVFGISLAASRPTLSAQFNLERFRRGGSVYDRVFRELVEGTIVPRAGDENGPLAF